MMRRQPIQAMAYGIQLLVLLLCLALASASAAASSVTQRSAQTPQEELFTTEKMVAQHLHDIETILAQIADKLAEGSAITDEWRTLTDTKAMLLAADAAMCQRFAQREQEILGAGLPEVILLRHRETVNSYATGFRILIDSLSQIEYRREQGNPADFLTAVNTARQELAQRSKQNRLTDASGCGLQMRSEHQVVPTDRPSSLVFSGVAGARAAIPEELPVPADLAATIDVQITPDIIETAATLDHSALKIYQYVKNNFAFELYPGSRKGSQQTLLLRGGNDFDLASLLIALLRAANIPARYVMGDVALTQEQAVQWLGVEDADAAVELLQRGGFTASRIETGIYLRHVWVAAYVPYANYRGLPNDATGPMWVPLDPSIKQLHHSQALNVPSVMNFDAQAFFEEYISTFHALSPVELYLQRIQSYMVANRPDLTYPGDAFRRAEIAPDNLGLLPASLPYQVYTVTDDFAAIPASLRQQIEFVLFDWGAGTTMRYVANLPEIAGRRITLSYIAATPADQATIDYYGGLYLTPPDLIYLKPVLKIDGETMVVGDSTRAAADAELGVGFLGPDNDPYVGGVFGGGAGHGLFPAGAYVAIGLNTYRADTSVFSPNPNDDWLDADSRIGGKLFRTIMTWHARFDRDNRTLAQTMQMALPRRAVAEGIVRYNVVVTDVFGTDLAWELFGLTIDVPRAAWYGFPTTGNSSQEKQFNLLAGINGSIGENRIFEDILNEEAVSAVKILELASDLGIPICRITTSIEADCPNMTQSPDVIREVNRSLGGSNQILIPQSAVSYLQWRGAGWVVQNLETGYAAYIILGDLNGGGTAGGGGGPNGGCPGCGSPPPPPPPPPPPRCEPPTPPSPTAEILEPSPNSYWPAQHEASGFQSTKPVFKVQYTVYYYDPQCALQTKTFVDIFEQSFPPGDHTWSAGRGTNASVSFTVFDVEIETPEDVFAPKDGAPISLRANATPRMPPGAVFTWRVQNTGAGVFANPTAQSTQFSGKTAGEVTVKVGMANSNGEVTAERELTVYDVEIEKPTGDPVFQGSDDNEFTYHGADGVAKIPVVARITPASAEEHVAGMIKWSLIAIPDGSTLSWNSPGSKGLSAGWGKSTTATLRGYPLRNDEFGPNTVRMEVISDDGATVASKTADIELFYERDAVATGFNAPNWFRYWLMAIRDEDASYKTLNINYGGKSGPVVNGQGPAGRVPAMSYWSYTVPQDKTKIIIYEPAKEALQSPCKPDSRTFGIDAFENAIRHEREHIDQIRRADALVISAANTPWRYGWSWKQEDHNHWTVGKDVLPGRAGCDDDGDGPVDNLDGPRTSELGQQNHNLYRCLFDNPPPTDDEKLSDDKYYDWPTSFGPYPNICPGLHPIEDAAYESMLTADNLRAHVDWACPGKQHRINDDAFDAPESCTQ